MQYYSIPDVYERLLHVTGRQTKTELANYFGIRHSDLSMTLKNEDIPARWLLKIARERNICLTWLLTGMRYCPAEDGLEEKAHTALRRASTRDLIDELTYRLDKLS